MPAKSACSNLSKDQCLPPDCTYVNGATRKYCRANGNKTKKVKTLVLPKPVVQKTPVLVHNDSVPCKQLSQDNCLPPRCQYINGKIRKYCTNAKTKKTTKIQPLRISPIQKSVKKREVNPEKEAIQKIGKFIKKSKFFLNIVCKESGECLAFGKQTNNLNRFFKGFVDFDYISSPMKKIGASSVNGIIYELEYKRDGYNAHAILKSSKSKYSDNLIYEYVVGMKMINRIIQSFPCFVETYALFEIAKDLPILESPEASQVQKYMKKLVSYVMFGAQLKQTKQLLKSLTLRQNIDYAKACREPTQISILIQHIQNAKTLDSCLSQTFVNEELMYILFIIYHALYSLRKSFTHYDLHTDNVLIYNPDPNKYIHYHYHETDGTILSFKSPYIPKIIDYGRSFFDNGNVTSAKIYKKICKLNECKPNCGEYVGFSYLNPKNKSRVFLISSKKNESYDLRLLNIIKRHIERSYKNISQNITDFLSKIEYGHGIKQNERKVYGTEENLTVSSTNVYNVECAYRELRNIISDTVEQNKNNKVNGNKTKLGDFYIYADQRPMEFIKAT